MAGAATLLAGIPGAARAEAGTPEFCIFSKHLQGLGFDQIADIAAGVGANGIEAPIRPGGHVEPERVEEELPKLVDALRKSGLQLTILTSGINEVSAAQHTEKVLRTAKALGVRRFRMGFCRYDLSQPIWPQLAAWGAKFKDVIRLSREIGIQPLSKNHSGRDYVGGPVWDVYSLMKDYPAREWAFAFDLYHATVEGGKSWPLEVNLVRDHVGAAYFKDFRWGAKGVETCRLGEGVVNREAVGMLKKAGFNGPVSLHVEYLEPRRKEPNYVQEAIVATRRDLAVLKEWWK